MRQINQSKKPQLAKLQEAEKEQERLRKEVEVMEKQTISNLKNDITEQKYVCEFY